MTAIFVFPAKTNDKEYKFYQNPREVLELDDDKILKLTTNTRGVGYIIRHDEKWDGLSDSEIMAKYNETYDKTIQLSSRKTGQGYSTADKDCFVRIIRKEKGDENDS